MGRTTSNTVRNRLRRARPVMEGLEDRLVLSVPAGGLPAAVQAMKTTRITKFAYKTSSGRSVVIQLIGRGSLEGTKVGPDDALNLVYSKTNSKTAILSKTHGGGENPTLRSIKSLGVPKTGLSGVGETLVGLINLRQFDLVSGGIVNVTAGLNLLGLNSVAPNSQIQVREIPQSSQLTKSTSTSSSVIQSSSVNNGNSVIQGAFLVQTFAGGDGEFLSAGNIVQISDSTKPGAPPAPPGVVIQINHVNGGLTESVNLLNDVKIFGYDPVKSQVLRFSLDLEDLENGKGPGKGTLDNGFAPIDVIDGTTSPVGVALGRVYGQQVLVVAAGSEANVYNATNRTFLGKFTIPATFTNVGSTDYVTVLGSTNANELSLIDLAASLTAGKATPPPGNPTPYTYNPPGGVSLVGGLTGLPGSTRAYSTVGAKFDSFQPLQDFLGEWIVNTTSVSGASAGKPVLINRLSSVSTQVFKPFGKLVPVPPNNIGEALGSVDHSLALNTTGASSDNPVPNTISLYSQITLQPRGSIVLDYKNQLTDLSETFRPDIAGSALIDVQGNLQSIRGQTATGMVLNVTGNLNLVKFDSLEKSSIVGQPFGHLEVGRRSDVSILSSKRSVGGRHGVTVVPGLQQIGPLSLPNDSL